MPDVCFARWRDVDRGLIRPRSTAALMVTFWLGRRTWWPRYPALHLSLRDCVCAGLCTAAPCGAASTASGSLRDILRRRPPVCLGLTSLCLVNRSPPERPPCLTASSVATFFGRRNPILWERGASECCHGVRGRVGNPGTIPAARDIFPARRHTSTACEARIQSRGISSSL